MKAGMMQYAVANRQKGVVIVNARNQCSAVKKVCNTPSGYHWECFKTTRAYNKHIGYHWSGLSKFEARVMCETGEVYYCGVQDND